MLSLCLCVTFKFTGMENFNSNVTANCISLISDFYWFINLINLKQENIALILLTNAYNSSGLIKFKEKI